MALHDIWNPWHGCRRVSEGCQNCYMFFLDRSRGRDGSVIYRTQTGFRYPLAKDRNGQYKVRGGEMLRVCMNSDFFLEEADEWRPEAWEIIRERPDVIFFLLTKRPERVARCLPSDWGQGYENVFFHVTCENQRRAEERLPLLLELPFRHKGVMCAPLIGPVSLAPYLADGQIQEVLCDGENYAGARPCEFSWVQTLSRECREQDVTFRFFGTGEKFVKDGKLYHLKSPGIQREMARKSGMSYEGKPIRFHLRDAMGLEFPWTEPNLYAESYRECCETCSDRISCGGCSGCRSCEKSKVIY